MLGVLETAVYLQHSRVGHMAEENRTMIPNPLGAKTVLEKKPQWNPRWASYKTSLKGFCYPVDSIK